VSISSLRVSDVRMTSEDFRAFYSSGRFHKLGKMMFNVNSR
jgi:hypothetical protein